MEENEITTPESTEPKAPVEERDTSNDTVAYKTYRKVLEERKSDQAKTRELEAKLAKFEAEKKKQLEEELRKKEDYKTLLATRDEEIKKVKGELTARQERDLEAKKVNAFLKALDVPIPDKYWGLIPREEIVINPDTGEIDKANLNKVVDKYKTQYPETFAGQGVRMPNAVTTGNKANGITRKQWLELPSSQMMSRKADIID